MKFRLLNLLVLFSLLASLMGAAIPAYGANSSYTSNSTGRTGINFQIDVPYVQIRPVTASLGLNETQTFSATVSGATSEGVTWSVVSGGGTINADGEYTAPSTLPTPPRAVIRATDTTDSTLYAEATIYLSGGLAGGYLGEPIMVNPQDGGKVISADMNGDGLADLVRLSSYHSEGDIVVALSNGDSFTELPAVEPGFPTAYQIYQGFYRDLTAGDMDGDGDLDIVATANQAGSNNGGLCVLLNDGTGKLTAGPLLPLGDN